MGGVQLSDRAGKRTFNEQVEVLGKLVVFWGRVFLKCYQVVSGAGVGGSR